MFDLKFFHVLLNWKSTKKGLRRFNWRMIMFVVFKKPSLQHFYCLGCMPFDSISFLWQNAGFGTFLGNEIQNGFLVQWHFNRSVSPQCFELESFRGFVMILLTRWEMWLPLENACFFV